MILWLELMQLMLATKGVLGKLGFDSAEYYVNKDGSISMNLGWWGVFVYPAT